MKRKVSVIIPVYNAESTLKRCLDSVGTQTYTNLEFLLINDGSTDNSLEICQAYAAKDPRIAVHTQKNAGPSAARNNAIDMATGDYLTFVDSDDYIEPDMIERMVAAAEEHAVDMVICNYYEELGTAVKRHHYSNRSGFYDHEECHRIAIDIVDNNTKTRIPPYSCIRMIRREILENPRLRYNSGIKRSEDYLLWTQVHFRIQSMYLMGDAYLYHYMDNPGSITRSYLKGYWPMCRLLYAELKNNLPESKDVQQRLQAMLIQRSLIALHNAAIAGGSQFETDAREVLNDKELIRAAWSVGLVRNSKRAKIYALLVMLRLKFLIKRIFLSGK